MNWRDDRGQVAGLESIPFGILLFVVGALLIANAWAVIDVKMAVASAAREAARSYVEAPDHDQGRANAESAAREALAAHHRDAAQAVVEGPSDPSAFTRCNRVTFTVSYPVPAITLPFIGGFGTGFIVKASHSELVDPFRDDVPGEALCG
jgi:hypothetical protein